MNKLNTITCAICGKPIDLTQWYDVISERPVHSACFQASRAVGYRLPLIPQVTTINANR